MLNLRSFATVTARLGYNLVILTLPKTFDEQYWSRVAYKSMFWNLERTIFCLNSCE